MTAFVLAILHAAGVILAAALLIVAVLFILAVCIVVTLCAIFHPETNGYAQRYRDIAGRAKAERKRTLTELPHHEDPRIVGDVSQSHWPKAHYPHSRANVRGEG